MTKANFIAPNMPAEEYHAQHDYISNSMLKVFRDSRRKYHDYYVAKTDSRKATKSMELGTVAHAAILEPHIIETVCCEIPSEVLNGDGHRKGRAWTEWRDAQGDDKILLTTAEVRTVRNMFDAAYANKDARKFLTAKGETELSVFWECSSSGLKRRCRIDKHVGRYIVDVKTAADASPKAFASQAADLMYDQQDAFYCEGAREVMGIEPQFVFIVVQNDGSGICAVYELPGDWVDMARQEMNEALWQLAQCQESGDWREPFEKSPQVLHPPAWRTRRSEWEVNA